MQIHDGGTSAGLAGQFEMTADAVRDIANRAMESTRSRTERKAHDFGDIDLPPAAFGGWPEGRRLGRHHDGAHQVLLETINGVVADLEEFAANLRATADTAEAQDEQVEAALVSLGRRYREHTFHSDANYTDKVGQVSGQENVRPGEAADQGADVRGADPGQADGQPAASGIAPAEAAETGVAPVDATTGDPAEKPAESDYQY